MKRLTLILSLLLVPTITLAQQPAEFTIKITPAEADVIWEGLRELPVKKVEPIMQKMRQQVMEQTTPKPVEQSKEDKKE